jgi:uncharacterized protein
MRYPASSPAWLQSLDQWTRDAGFFLFGGKAYGIFALLFGVSFFMILDRWSQRGINFESRFLWRLFILGVFGYIHALIYCGDILLIIAALGVPLVVFYRCGTRALVLISVLLLAQLPSLWETGRVLLNPSYAPPRPQHWGIYDQLTIVYADGTFLDVLKTNLWKGQLARIAWTIETGRYTQMLGLFVLGLLLGRSRVFSDPTRRARLAKSALLWGALGFAVIYPVKSHLADWGLKDLRHYVVDNLISAYCNLAQISMWAGGFTLFCQWTKADTLMRFLSPCGRMSLTCYVTQGLVGVPLFYGFGFALYRELGPFYSTLFGAALFTLQSIAARLWLKNFAYGPLEWLWRSCTSFSFVRSKISQETQFTTT